MSMLATIAKPAYDNSIKSAPSGSAFAYKASTGVLDANFGATIGTADAIQLQTQGGYTFGWRPDTVNVIDTSGNITQIDAVNTSAAAQVWQNKISYVGTTAATSDEFTVEGTKLKHDVRMVAPPSLPSGYTSTPQYLAIGGDIGTTSADWADVELWADGAVKTATFTTTGALSFRLISTGKEIYNMPAVTLTDDAGNVQTGGYLVEFGSNNSVTLYTLAPWDWMQAAQYPVVIDPTVIVNSALDISGNGGRKIVRLSNGDIVVAVRNAPISSSAYAISASSEYMPAANGVYGTGTYWYANGGEPGWWQADLGSSQFVGVAAFMPFIKGGTLPVSLQISADGSTWTTVESFSPTYVDQISVYIGQTCQYVRVYWGGGSSDWPEMGNFAVWTAAPYSLYLSEDNGQTFSKLVDLAMFGDTGIAVSNSGTTIYGIIGGMNSIPSGGSSPPPYSGAIHSFSLDESTVTAGSAITSFDVVDSEQLQFLPGVSYVIDGNGKKHASWTTKNSGQPSTWNTRYNNSTDGATWPTPVQVTYQNVSGDNYGSTNCTIDENNNVHIFNIYTTGSYVTVYDELSTNGGSSFTSQMVAQYNPYTQTDPCGVVDTNGAIHLVWSGTDSTYSNPQIKYSKSTDGGTTWSGPINLTTDNAYSCYRPTITLNENTNDLYVFFDGYDATSTSYTNVQTLKYTSSLGTWSGPTSITSNTTANASNAQSLWSEFNMNSSDAIRIMYEDSQAGSVEYYTVPFDNPPNAPILNPVSNFDATTEAAFSWQFSDPDPGDSQSAYELQIYDVAGATTVVDTGKVASTTTNYTLAANTLANGKQYQWRVTTWDSSGEQGPYSAYATFNTAAAPTVTITSPAAGATDASSSETVQWSFSDPASNTQQSFRVKLLDSTDATVLWDSGTMQGSGNQLTIGYTLANNTTYHIQVTATSSAEIASNTADVSFSTSFTAPAQGALTVTPDSVNAKMTLAITNPAPSGSEPAVSSNDLYRKQSWQTDWTRIATGLGANASYEDYEVGSGVSYDYKVTSYGNNGTQIDSATVSGVSVTFTGTWLHDVSAPSGTILNLPYYWNMMAMGGQTPNGEQWTPTATQLQFAGRTDPIVEFGEAETLQVTKGSMTMDLSSGAWVKLSQMLRGQTTLCLRDGRGRVVFGNVLGYQEVDLVYGNQVQTLTFTQTAYSIAV